MLPILGQSGTNDGILDDVMCVMVKYDKVSMFDNTPIQMNYSIKNDDINDPVLLSPHLTCVIEEWEANPFSTLGFIVSVVVKI